MTLTRRGLVWVDHHEARLIHPLPDAGQFEAVVVAGDSGHTHESKQSGGRRQPISRKFADRVADAVRAYGNLAIVGPSTAKDELMHQLRDHHREIADRVAVVEPLDRVPDAQLAAHARELFDRVDRTHGVHVPRA